MDLKLIRRVVELMKDNELTAFEVEEEGFKLNLRRGNSRTTQWVEAPAMYASPASTTHTTNPIVNAPHATSTTPPVVPLDEMLIASPMVGTFYRASSPDVDPYVKVGDEVEDDSTVCIIEAMKVMNEIKAELKGRILDILVENATPVEYGQPLFRVRKS